MSHVIHQNTLSNGVPVVLTQIPGAKSISSYFCFTVGSRHESRANNGISHFLEHMAFNGTEDRSAYEIQLHAEEIGANINAATSPFMTFYTATGHSEGFDATSRLLTEVVAKPIFPESAVLTERDIITEEINQQNDDPDDVLMNLRLKAMFGDSSMGQTVLGPVDNVSAMTRKHLAEYFGTHYHSGNMIISVAGNLDPAYVMGVLENTLVPVQNSGSKTPTDPAVFQGGLVLENRNLHQVRLSMCFQSSKASDVHNYASEIVLGQILGGGMASRLFQEVREKRGLAYSVGADARAFMDLSTMTIGAGVNPEKIGEALGAIQEVIMGADKISDEDVLRAKNMLLTDLATSRETVDSHAQAGFSDFMEHGHVIATEKKITALRAVTAPDVSNAAIRVFSTTPSLAAIGPAANLKEVERAHSTLGM